MENVLKETEEWEQADASTRVKSFLPSSEETKLSVAVEPVTAATNGFFVALFKRIKR